MAFILIAKFLKKIKVPVRIPEAGKRKPKTKVIGLALVVARMPQLGQFHRTGNDIPAGRSEDVIEDQRNQQAAAHAPERVAVLMVAQLVAEDKRQRGFVGHRVKQTLRDDDTAPRHGEGVGRLLVPVNQRVGQRSQLIVPDEPIERFLRQLKLRWSGFGLQNGKRRAEDFALCLFTDAHRDEISQKPDGKIKNRQHADHTDEVLEFILPRFLSAGVVRGLLNFSWDELHSAGRSNRTAVA